MTTRINNITPSKKLSLTAMPVVYYFAGDVAEGVKRRRDERKKNGEDALLEDEAGRRKKHRYKRKKIDEDAS